MFKNHQGEVEFLAAYEALMQRWPVPYETYDIPGPFGRTHLVTSGPQNGSTSAESIVLLHGGRATLTMWAPNVADLSRDYKVYAVDVMGQPGKSIPNASFQKREQLLPWFTELLDTLGIARSHLIGQSYGGWFALNYAIHQPERVNKLALLSPAASFLPLNAQHFFRGALMFFFPSRRTVGSFKRWETLAGNIQSPENLALFNTKVDLLALGNRYFRCQGEATPDTFSDEALKRVQAPTLLLIGQQEVIYDPVASLERACRLIPNIEASLIPNASHDMSYFQAAVVDSKILRFLRG